MKNEFTVIDNLDQVDKMSDEEVLNLYRDMRFLPMKEFNEMYDISKVGAIPLYDYLTGRYNSIVELNINKIPRIIMTVDTVKAMDAVALLMFLWDSIHLDPFEAKYDIDPSVHDEVMRIVHSRVKEIKEWLGEKALEEAGSIIFREKQVSEKK